MHPLLRLALLACPGDFRREYENAIAQDVRTRGLNAAAAAADLLWQGTQMRFESLGRDVVLAGRSLARSPVFTSVAVVTIALAIGINLTGFSILKGLVLDSLPYAHASRLAFVSVTRRGVDQVTIDYPDARDFSRRSRTFDAIAVASTTRGTLTGMGRPADLTGCYVGGAYFRILGARAELGRLLSTRDLGTHNVVISDALWRSRFGANASVLGRRISIDAVTYTIVGVAPSSLLAPGPGFMAVSDYWLPLDPRSADWRGSYFFWAIGLLKRGVTWPQAQADLSRVAAQLAREYPNFDKYDGVRVSSLSAVLTANTRTLVVALFCAALLVVFIAAANLANLLLARALARRPDMAIRAALGATRWRIAVQLAVEAGLVGVAGFGAGVALSWFILHLMSAFLAVLGHAYGMNMIEPGWNRVGVDLPVILYGAALTALFTLGAPILQAYAHRGGVRGGRQRLRAGLVLGEIALAFAVLTIAGLLLRSFVILEQRPIGFTEANTYSVQVDAPLQGRYARSGVVRFYKVAEQRLRALPGVAAASEALIAGLSQESHTNYSLDRPVGSKGKAGTGRFVAFNAVDTGFFGTLRIPLLAGRTFSASDTGRSQPVAIVSRSFAVKHFASVKAAVGKYVSVGESTGQGFPLRRIVGVVGDVRHSLSAAPSAEVYAPFSQIVFPGAFIVRTRGEDPHLAGDVDRVFSGIDPLLPPPHILSFEVLRSIDDAGRRMAAAVFFGLAAAALFLALAGIYGVVAYNVERRTHEFGIRMSVGAAAPSIALLVLREGVVLALAGIAAGTLPAALAARALSQFLYQTSPLDARTYAAAAGLLLVAVGLSSLLPALRAMRVQPATALHYE